MPSPWLSVIMPTYNGEPYLPQALESIRAQGDAGIEVIAIDDGSTDTTPEILKSYSDRIPLRLISIPRTGNWVANTNRAAARAQGEYMCFLHQDDFWMQGRLDRVRRLLRSSPQTELLLHGVWYVDRCGRKLGTYRPPLPECPGILSSSHVLPRFLTQNFTAIPAPVFRTASFRECGGMDEALWYTADWDLWLKLAALGRTRCLSSPLAAYRLHPLSQTSTRSHGTEEFREQHLAVVRRHLPRISGNPALYARVESLARFSAEVNSALASLATRQTFDLGPLAARLLGLGPSGILRYLSWSRILERLAPRLRARLWTPRRK